MTQSYRKLSFYVASSWRNYHLQPAVVEALRAEGFTDTYDFRHPLPGNEGFKWSDIDPDWQSWSPEAFKLALDHPIAEQGFDLDFTAMSLSDVGVLVMPCGRSAHIEAGYFVGHPQKRLIILLDSAPTEPELMYKMADAVCLSLGEVMDTVRDWQDRGLKEQLIRLGNA